MGRARRTRSSAEFKAEAIRLGRCSSDPLARVARDLGGLPETRRQGGPAAQPPPEPPLTVAERGELPRLRQALRTGGAWASSVSAHHAERARRGVGRQSSRAGLHRPRPNRVWAGDITAIWTAEGWRYLAVWLDLAAPARRGMGGTRHAGDRPAAGTIAAGARASSRPPGAAPSLRSRDAVCERALPGPPGAAWPPRQHESQG